MSIITVTTANDSGAGSLREAIANAQSGDTIQFSSGLANQTITLTNGQLSIPDDKDLTIDGATAPGLTISGNNASRIFLVNSTYVSKTSLTVKNLTLANGFTPDQGGAILTTNQAVLAVDSVVFKNNVANHGGGAIFSAYEGTLTVTNSKFDGNKAIAGNDERGAGAIAFWGPGPLVVKNSEFTNNQGINGGAINSLNGKLTIENSRFFNNDTTTATFATGQPNDFLRGYGGAIYTDRASLLEEPSGTIRISNSVFENNRGKGEGGAAYLYTGNQDNVILQSNLFRNNEVTALPGGNDGNGGGVVVLSNGLNQGLIVQNTTFANNTATNQGGGLWMMGAPTTISNSTFSGNRVSGNDYSKIGGGMALYDAPTNIVNSTIANNFAGWVGGGLTTNQSQNTTVKNTIFYNNTAANGGNPWNIQQHTGGQIVDQGGNIQYPPGIDSANNVTANVTLADPKLGPLQLVNGTYVHPLLTGSPAINTGVAGAPITDETGAMRDARPDIGAVEFGSNTAQLSLPTLSINDVSLAEGNSGLTNAVFTVGLSAASTQPVSVNYETANGTAIAGSDYAASSGLLNFNPGEVTKTVSVPIIGDTLAEPDETFVIDLIAPSNATILKGQGLGTIQNDDLPVASVSGVNPQVGSSDSGSAVLTVQPSSLNQLPIVSYGNQNGSTIANSTYAHYSELLTANSGHITKIANTPVDSYGNISAGGFSTAGRSILSPTPLSTGDLSVLGGAYSVGQTASLPKLFLSTVRDRPLTG